MPQSFAASQLAGMPFVGAGTVVIRSVADFALVVGNPARQIGWMCVCAKRIRLAKDESVLTCSSLPARLSSW